VKGWVRWKNVLIPIFKTEEDTTFIIIFHDAACFFLFFNQDGYSFIEKVCSILLEGSKVVQVNDTLIEQEEDVSFMGSKKVYVKGERNKWRVPNCLQEVKDINRKRLHLILVLHLY